MLDVSTVLVTGANRGLGYEFVRQLALNEPKIDHIIATCRNPDEADQLKTLSETNENVKILQLDVTDYDSLDGFAEQVEKIIGDSGLDILINNAGILIPTDVDNVTPKEFMKNFEINAVGPFMLTRKLAPLIKKSKRKLIVAISSGAGSITRANAKLGGFPAYKASKASMNIITRTYADHLKADGVSSIIFCPGWCKTDLGGPNAMYEPDFSVSNMIKNISTLTPESDGTFINFEGKPMPF